MLLYEIEPYVGVGPIAFGTARDDLPPILRAAPLRWEPEINGLPQDFYADLGIFIIYRPPGIVESVLFGGGAMPAFRSRPLLKQAYDATAAWLMALDPDATLVDTELTTPAFGFTLSAPSLHKDPATPIESVEVFDHVAKARKVQS